MGHLNFLLKLIILKANEILKLVYSKWDYDLLYQYIL
jgi:hypothetical protein